MAQRLGVSNSMDPSSRKYTIEFKNQHLTCSTKKYSFTLYYTLHKIVVT